MGENGQVHHGDESSVGVNFSKSSLGSSGLIDSLALVDILLKLEDVTGTRIPAGRVQPKDVDTVRLMFSAAARVGKPRNK